ncbi:MAG: TauD/TfdA dioxygenase family protein [Caulobacterales bacterium]
MPQAAAQALELAPFTLAPLTPTIGAEIGGIDIGQPLDTATIAALRAALLEWKVIFFREQDITVEQHLAFGRQFGVLEINPFNPQLPDHPEVIPLNHGPNGKGAENAWHSDVTWSSTPSMGSILRAVVVPDAGGDTLFADMYAAYETLDDETKQLIEGRKAMHYSNHMASVLRRLGATEEKVAETVRNFPPVEHPIVRTHPETGRKALYVNTAFTTHIVGMEAAESKALLRRLYAQASIPEHQCRFKWRPNSLAFWDNRCSQHYAASDYFPAVRRMQRVTIVGDRPY